MERRTANMAHGLQLLERMTNVAQLFTFYLQKGTTSHSAIGRHKCNQHKITHDQMRNICRLPATLGTPAPYLYAWRGKRLKSSSLNPLVRERLPRQQTGATGSPSGPWPTT